MKTASIADVKAQFSGYLRASRAGPIVVTDKGKPVAVLLSMQDEDELERLLMAYSPKLQRILRAAQKQIRSGKGIKHKDFWRQVKGDQ